jgi:hypothetical protein
MQSFKKEPAPNKKIFKKVLDMFAKYIIEMIDWKYKQSMKYNLIIYFKLM